MDLKETSSYFICSYPVMESLRSIYRAQCKNIKRLFGMDPDLFRAATSWCVYFGIVSNAFMMSANRLRKTTGISFICFFIALQDNVTALSFYEFRANYSFDVNVCRKIFCLINW